MALNTKWPLSEDCESTFQYPYYLSGLATLTHTLLNVEILVIVCATYQRGRQEGNLLGLEEWYSG